jgi:hypothetical protein
MAAARFEVNDTVRLIGTEVLLTVRQYNRRTHEYQVQRGNDSANFEWVLAIYLELVEAAQRPAMRA